MFKVTVDTVKLERLAKSMPRIADTAAFRITREEAKPLLQQEMPIDSGVGKNSVAIERESSGVYVTGHDIQKTRLPNGDSYMDYQYYGTRGPYIIFPKKPGGTLVFQAGGKTVFAKWAIHPGLKPDKFVDRAIFRMQGGGATEVITINEIRKFL